MSKFKKGDICRIIKNCGGLEWTVNGVVKIIGIEKRCDEFDYLTKWVSQPKRITADYRDDFYHEDELEKISEAEALAWMI